MLINAVIGSAGLRIASMGLGFLVGVQLARGLGAEGYGIYGVAMSVIALISLPVEFGMPQLLVREVAAAQVAGNLGRMRGVLYWSRRSALLFSGVTVVAMLAWLLTAGHGFERPLSKALLAGVLLIPMVVFCRLWGAALQGLHHIVSGQLPDTVIRPAAFALLLFLMHLCTVSLSPALAMVLGALSAAIAFFVAWTMLRRALPVALPHARREIDARRWWASALPMALTEGMRGLQGNIATLVMGGLATAASVGVFRVASSVSVVISIPITLFIIVGSPAVSRLHMQGDIRRMQRLLGWLGAGMTFGSAVLTVAVLIFGQWLLVRLFGVEFEASNGPLLILCAGSILYSALGPAFIVLNMSGHEKRVTRAFIISVAVLLLLAIPLVKFYGADGAALASAFSFVLSNVIMRGDTRRLLGLESSIISLLHVRNNYGNS